MFWRHLATQTRVARHVSSIAASRPTHDLNPSNRDTRTRAHSSSWSGRAYRLAQTQPRYPPSSRPVRAARRSVTCAGLPSGMLDQRPRCAVVCAAP
eukprot:6078926-Prymnesium_polylepis.2